MSGKNGSFTSSVNGNTVSYTESFPKDVGSTQASGTMTVAEDCNSFSGSANWTWSDGTESCSGTTQVSAIRNDPVGCGASTSDPGVSTTVTAAELVGTWLLACQAESGYSFNGTLTFTATDATLDLNVFDTTSCTSQFAMGITSYSYTLGSDITLDGTVAGITTGTEIDLTNTTTGSSDFGIIDYVSIALVGTSLYIGDDLANFLKDGSTPAARPTKLEDFPYIKQQ